MSFSGMGSWTAVDMPPPSSVPVVNQTLKRADEVEKDEANLKDKRTGRLLVSEEQTNKEENK